MQRHHRRSFVLAAVVGAALGLSSAAHADDIKAQARDDYRAGAAAYARKDYAAAARLFARADERMPNGRVLLLALAAALSDADAVIAMTLVERAEGRALKGPAAELLRGVRQRFSRAAGKVRLVCPGSVTCRARIREREIGNGEAMWLTIGNYQAELWAEGHDPTRKLVEVEPQAVAELTPSEEELIPTALATPKAREPAAPAVAERHGLPPLLFWSSCAATAVGIGASVLFTVVANQKGKGAEFSPSPETMSDAEAARTTARLSWLGTGVLAATSVALGFYTDFEPRAKASRVSLKAGPGSLYLTGQFQ
jgi:hypothetical protein